MALPLDTSANEPAALPTLAIRRPDGSEFVHELASGSGAIAGSDRTCSLHLDGEGVASLHCMIRFQGQQIFVKDWYSETGTFINNHKIDGETILPEGGEIRVGEFTITVRFNAAPVAEESVENNAATATVAETHFESLEPAASLSPTDDNELAPDDSEPFDDFADSGLEPIRSSNDDMSCDWIDQPQFDNDENESQFGFETEFIDDGCDPETFALLKSEVEVLQNELAQRDARLAELTAVAGDESRMPAATTDTSETAALVDRLEQLLDELNQSDERMATMEELLKFAEEANVADREERRQIDSWVGDIECRISEREAEWKAEMEVLRRRIEEVTEERNQIERRIGKAGASKEQQAEFQRILEKLRAQAETLRNKYDESQAENARLVARLEELNGEGLETLLAQRLDETMREERLEHAREQANMARERAELSRVKMELEQLREVKQSGHSEIDGKFRVFRDHLKDLHEQESQERLERQERSLSSRLSKLWKRLEGRSS